MSELWFSMWDTILFAIPEAIFVTVITYILLKRYDLIDIYKIKSSLSNILIPSVTATIIMMSLSCFGVGFIRKIIGLAIFYCLLLFITNKNTFTNIIRGNIKLLICFFISFFIAMIVESACMLLLMGLLNIDSFNLLNNNDNFNMKVITAFSWIIVESLIVIILNVKKNNKLITILHTILKHKELLKISIFVIVTIMALMFMFIYLVLFKSFLTNIDIIWQMIITISVIFVLPLSTMLVISNTVIILINTEKRFQQLYQEIDN